MAAQKGARAVEKKRKSKKRKSRTEVSSSESSSDSEVEQKKSEESISTEGESEQSASEPSPEPSKALTRKKLKTISTQPTNGDTPMHNASPSSPALEPVLPSRPKEDATSGKQEEKFDAIYIRKITTELADDLDKVREAQDFKANSIPMLIHALKQGESLFSVEEKGRVIATLKV